MNKLRIFSILSTIIIIAVFFGTAEIFKEHIVKTEKANVENPFLPYAGLFLFGLPPSVAGIIISFLKTTKSKIIILCSIIGASYIAIFIIAFLMVEYPPMFGISETYWETDQ